MSDAAEDTAAEDEAIATLSDYMDGTLPADRIKEVEARIASDDLWKRTHDEMKSTKEALSGVLKARAPASFEQDITATIHKRSAGRFFGRRTFGDRVPFGLLLVVAMIVLAIVGYVLYSSSTGSLKVDKRTPDAGRGSGLTLPKP